MELRQKELGKIPFMHCCDSCGKFLQEGQLSTALTYESSDGNLIFLFMCMLCDVDLGVEV